MKTRGSVQTAIVTRGSLVATASAAGNVSAPTTVSLVFQTSGRITHVNAQVGDTVKKGQVLMAPEGDPETSRRVLHGMRREVQRLTRLVSDLLTLTRLDAHRTPNPQALDLAVLGREVVESIKPLAKTREIVVETDGDTKCSGDADQLKQVFYNLLDNAIHAVDAEKGKIVLRLQGLEETARYGVG